MMVAGQVHEAVKAAQVPIVLIRFKILPGDSSIPKPDGAKRHVRPGREFEQTVNVHSEVDRRNCSGKAFQGWRKSGPLVAGNRQQSE